MDYPTVEHHGLDISNMVRAVGFGIGDVRGSLGVILDLDTLTATPGAQPLMGLFTMYQCSAGCDETHVDRGAWMSFDMTAVLLANVLEACVEMGIFDAMMSAVEQQRAHTRDLAKGQQS